MRTNGSWIRAITRWAVYLRDGLQCTYCLRGVEDLLHDGTFLTLDHVDPRGGNDARNLVTCCHDCNTAKGTMTVSRFAVKEAAVASTYRRRVSERRRKPVAEYRKAAEILLGLTPWAPRANVVIENDRAARRHFQARDPVAAAEYDYMIEQMSLVCSKCGQVHPDARDEVPF